MSGDREKHDGVTIELEVPNNPKTQTSPWTWIEYSGEGSVTLRNAEGAAISLTKEGVREASKYLMAIAIADNAGNVVSLDQFRSIKELSDF